MDAVGQKLLVTRTEKQVMLVFQQLFHCIGIGLGDLYPGLLR
jgi:hypothetical protein